MRVPYALMTLSAAVALSACTPGQVAKFNQPAGDELDTGDFGNATMNNTLVMNGDRTALVNLANQFAEEAPSTITFAFDSYVLDAEARTALNAQAEWIKRYPVVRFSVYGHTDKVGSDAYNKQLGLRRAQAAVNYMVSRGVPRVQLKALVSYGETQPLIVTENRERRNRRTVTEVSGYLKPEELKHDGKYARFYYNEYIESATEPHLQSTEDE